MKWYSVAYLFSQILQKDDLVGRVSFHKGDHILTIYTTEVTDPDTYQCEASNKDQYAGGVVTANQVKLNVKGKIITHAPVHIEHSFLGHQVVI